MIYYQTCENNYVKYIINEIAVSLNERRYMDKVFLQFLWSADSSGWNYDFPTLEECKEQWCFGMVVFEMYKPDARTAFEYGKYMSSNRMCLAKIKELGYEPIYQSGEIPQYHITA
jgi:hypothetical protein